MNQPDARLAHDDRLPEGIEPGGCEAAGWLALRTIRRGEELPAATHDRLKHCLDEAAEPIQGLLTRARVQAAPIDDLPRLAVELLHDRRSLVRDEASDALAAIGAPAFPAIRTLLADDDRDVRWYATEALAREGSAESIPLLVEQLKDDDFSIRWVASNGLLAAGSASVVPVVRALAHDEPTLLFHNAARRVLARVSASFVIHELLEELVDSLGRSTTTSLSQGLALELLHRLLGPQRSVLPGSPDQEGAGDPAGDHE